MVKKLEYIMQKPIYVHKLAEKTVLWQWRNQFHSEQAELIAYQTKIWNGLHILLKVEWKYSTPDYSTRTIISGLSHWLIICANLYRFFSTFSVINISANLYRLFPTGPLHLDLAIGLLFLLIHTDFFQTFSRLKIRYFLKVSKKVWKKSVWGTGQ